MEQYSIFESRTWSVADLTSYLRDLLESDELLRSLWVLGEVSNLSRPASGHIYFVLKDASATLRCVMWRSTASQQKWLPRDGDAVEVHGYISVYEAGGQYQLYVDQMRPAGEGLLYQRFLELKARLEAEGLFAPELKRPIPHWPKRIGLVTSPSGAALQDIINTIQRRYPLVELILAPAPVQGSEAPAALVTALQTLERLANPDVIILARGGGSIEDLWAFNDELLARTIRATIAPVICGVGHETDFTIADFASDVRAPTPTAAAELATPNRSDLVQALMDLRIRLERTIEYFTETQGRDLEMLHSRLRVQTPLARLRNDRQRLDDLSRRGFLACQHGFQLRRSWHASLAQRLSALNPQAVLGRGFAMVTTLPAETLVRQVSQVTQGDSIKIRVSDGVFPAQVLPGSGKGAIPHQRSKR